MRLATVDHCTGKVVVLPSRLAQCGAVKVDVQEIRFRNYKTLLVQFRQRDDQRGEPERGIINRFGEFVGISPRYLSHINNRRKNIGTATARQLEEAFKLPHGWLDHDHLSGPASSNRSEREFVELALRLFRESPVEAQAVLLKYMADRVMGSESGNKNEGTRRGNVVRPEPASRGRGRA